MKWVLVPLVSWFAYVVGLGVRSLWRGWNLRSDVEDFRGDL